ncbi:MAG TPA: matrixin family metalloprotease [Roseomonas sp.]|nr:matrixin family metalloprotease [Roseomonas sp.]
MAYALLGPEWTDPVITWSFAGPAPASENYPALTSAFDTTTEQAQLYKALEAWTEVSGLSFVHVADATGSDAPDLRIGFFDATGGGSSVNSGGQQVGVTYAYQRGGEFTAGVLVVVQDPAYWPWIIGPDGVATYTDNSITAAQVLTHEVGHALGLAHSDTPDDLMYYQVSGSNLGFSADDIAGIQSLYGGPLATEPTVSADVAAGPGGVALGSVIQFAAAGYLAANPEVAAAGTDPLQHFENFGWREGRDPAAQFDMQYYLAMNPDVAAAGMNPFAHYLLHGREEGRPAAAAIGHPDALGFDAEYYELANPDVARSGTDPWAHYTTFGWHEGRDPNGYFDTAAYLAHNTDVAAAGVNPLEHYIRSGAAEGRALGPDFDGVAYLAANPDVAAAGVNPLLHYMLHGIYEGRAAHSEWMA